MPLVDIEYHPPCTYYADGDHRERSGYYLCACKASRAWHKTVPVEPDYEAAWGYARHEDNGHIAARNNDNMVVLDKYDVMAVVDAALGIGGDE